MDSDSDGPKQRSGAQIIIERLQAHGIGVVAGMPGGANLPLYDALAQSRIRHVLVRHEQAAGFIAQGIARYSGRAGVCFATSGPGATNLTTALADARMDSIPMIAITGQVPTALIGTDAFQEVNTCAMVAPLVKHAEQVRRVEDLGAAIDRAFVIAESGRPGPVLIDVPKDVQQARTSAPHNDALITFQRTAAPSAADIDVALQELSRAQRPVLFVGGGVTQAGAHSALRELAAREQIPVASSLMGLGAMDPADRLYLGMIGMHAAPYTNFVMQEADLIVALGVRFDDRATGKLSAFCPNARTLHIDVDAREIGKLRRVQHGACCDARLWLEALLPHVRPRSRSSWNARVDELRRMHPLLVPPHRDPRCASHVLQHVAKHMDRDQVVTTDVGQHQMWVAQLLPFRAPRRLLTSGGLGSMGFGLPAAIGAALAGAPSVLCVTGDGSLMVNAQELATLAEENLNVALLLLDNRHLGLVHQQQTLFYGGRYSGDQLRQPTDFLALAASMGVAGVSLADAEDPFATLDAALAQTGPRIIVAPVRVSDHVLPMVPPGASNQDMLRLQDPDAVGLVPSVA